MQVLCAVLLAAAALAQQPEPAPLSYTGKPIVVPFQCTDDDIQWAGLSCSDEEPCPMYLELAAVEPMGNKLFAVGNIHAPAITLYSVLLASEDAGQTWREAYERMRGVGLDHIQFADFENGWISGQTLVPLPQDPFLLVSTDAGKTWRRRPVFGESHPGSILQFWFHTRTNGSMVIDRGSSGDSARYEMLESPNSGETWMIREANDRPIRLKRAANTNPDWRIRADAPSKSFQIEHRSGEKWTTMAAFAVPIGACKPPQRAEPKPPEEPPAPPPAAPAAPKPATPPSLKRPK